MNKAELLLALQRASRDQKLLARISRVLAYSFGVIPLEETPSELSLACSGWINPECLEFLRRYMGKSIHAYRCDPEIIERFLHTIYPQRRGVNLNTFESPDFLSDGKNAHLLTTEKMDDLGLIRSELRMDELVLLELSLYSHLQNLDRPSLWGEVELGGLDLPFRDAGGKVFVAGKPVGEGVLLIVRCDYFYDGVECRHGIMAAKATTLPFVIHPSEVQITQVHATGGLTFCLYDRFERVEPGRALQWQKDYHFLSIGNRFKRELALNVRAIRKVARADLEYATGPLPWTVEDLRRWLRLDLSDAFSGPSCEEPA